MRRSFRDAGVQNIHKNWKHSIKADEQSQPKLEQNGTVATDQTDALKVLTETRELLQALVNQINSQTSSDSGKCSKKVLPKQEEEGSNVMGVNR